MATIISALFPGPQDGITQITRAAGGLCGSRQLTWNFPLDVAYRAGGAFGWPQLVLCVYGADWAGRDVLKGYGAVHVPTCIGGCAVLPSLRGKAMQRTS